MAKITSVKDFFGLPASNWVERRYGDIQRYIGIMVVREEGSDQEIPFRLADSVDPIARFIEVFYTEVVVTATTTPARESTSLTGTDEPATIAISDVREATTEDMDLDDEGNPYPLTGKVESITILDQDAEETLGKFELISPATRQKRPQISADVLPGLILWMTSIESANNKSNVLYGSFYRPGPQGE